MLTTFLDLFSFAAALNICLTCNTIEATAVDSLSLNGFHGAWILIGFESSPALVVQLFNQFFEVVFQNLAEIDGTGRNYIIHDHQQTEEKVFSKTNLCRVEYRYDFAEI